MLGLEVKSHWLLSNCKTHSNSKAFLSSSLLLPLPPSFPPSLLLSSSCSLDSLSQVLSLSFKGHIQYLLQHLDI